MSESIKGIMDTTMDKMRTVVDADTIIGTPINVGSITLVPVSKVSFGVATGGSDFSTKTQSGMFGGGGGAGVSITPIAFIAINGSDIKMLPVYNELTSLERAISMTPELLEKVKELFNKDK
ncbi:MAG: sporulation protein YtfJ [Clostridia bacterium]|nr:sporulation protein YtfJ [Clostridia bacterium]